MNRRGELQPSLHEACQHAGRMPIKAVARPVVSARRRLSKASGWPTHGVYFFFEDG